MTQPKIRSSMLVGICRVEKESSNPYWYASFTHKDVIHKNTFYDALYSPFKNILQKTQARQAAEKWIVAARAKVKAKDPAYRINAKNALSQRIEDLTFIHGARKVLDVICSVDLNDNEEILSIETIERVEAVLTEKL